jgi:hypothetical protein
MNFLLAATFKNHTLLIYRSCLHTVSLLYLTVQRNNREEPHRGLDPACPVFFALEHRTKDIMMQSINLAVNFVALYYRFTFVYVMMSGMYIGVMHSFTLYIKS